jgi:hypothetical protein
MESIAHFKGRGVLRFHFSAVVNTGRRDIGVAEPFLNFGDVGFMVESVGGGGGAEGVAAHAKGQGIARIAYPKP